MQPIDYNRTFAIFLRAIPVVIIFYMFIISLMVGTAQQSIVEGLKTKNVTYDYSAAVRHYWDPEPLLGKQRRQAETVERETNRQARLRLSQARAERAAAIGFQNLRGQLRVLTLQAACEAVTSQGSTLADRIAMMGLAASAVSCVQQSENSANQQLVTRARDAEALGSQLQRLMDELENFQQQAGAVDTRVAALIVERDAFARQIDQVTRANDAMGVLEVFRDGWLSGGRPLIAMPPVLMGIVISFTSGLFGALLVTLILLVYPNQTANLTPTTAYLERLFLGGLVALGVFVVLFSGVAVLNGGSGVDIAQNVMAYAAIGILSGMFSDRAAGWLSRQPLFDPPPTPADQRQQQQEQEQQEQEQQEQEQREQEQPQQEQPPQEQPQQEQPDQEDQR